MNERPLSGEGLAAANVGNWVQATVSTLGAIDRVGRRSCRLTIWRIEPIYKLSLASHRRRHWL